MVGAFVLSRVPRRVSESGGHGHRGCATPWQLRATSDLYSQSDSFLVWQHDCVVEFRVQ